MQAYKLTTVTRHLSNLGVWLVNAESDRTCWGLLCYDVKYKNILSLKKDKREGGYNIMAVMHFDLLLTHHVYVKCKHAIPSNIHTEVAWSSLNNCEDTSKVILSRWSVIFSLLSFVPGLTYDRLVEKKLFASLPVPGFHGPSEIFLDPSGFLLRIVDWRLKAS